MDVLGGKHLIRRAELSTVEGIVGDYPFYSLQPFSQIPNIYGAHLNAYV